MPHKRRGVRGFEVCIHTCASGNGASGECINLATGTPLWLKEGLSCKHHAKAAKRHRTCRSSCPGYGTIKGLESCVTHPVTREELLDHIPEVRQIDRFSEDNYLAYIMDINVTTLNQVYPDH